LALGYETSYPVASTPPLRVFWTASPASILARGQYILIIAEISRIWADLTISQHSASTVTWDSRSSLALGYPAFLHLHMNFTPNWRVHMIDKAGMHHYEEIAMNKFPEGRCLF
jgi:hypothetical protein